MRIVASARNAEVVRETVTYVVVDGVATPDIFEGDLNPSECINEDGSTREYRFWDGSLKDKVTATYTPSEDAFDARLPGASAEIVRTGKYKGLWDRNGLGVATYELRGQERILTSGLASVVNDDGSVTESFSLDATFEFFDTTTGESTGDHYNIDGAFTTIYYPNGDVEYLGFEGTNDGTCRIDEGVS